MKLSTGLKTLAVICLLGLVFLWGVLLNANISWLKGYWSLLCFFYLTCNIILFAIGEKYSRFKVAARYLIIGVLNTLVDLGVLSFFLYFNPAKATGWFYVFFKALSFSLAIGNSYYFNGHFSFSDSKQTNSSLGRISKFLTVSLLAFVINLSFSTLLNHFNIWSLSPHFWGVLAAFIASMFGLIINFVGYRFWVFQKEQPSLLYLKEL